MLSYQSSLRPVSKCYSVNPQRYKRSKGQKVKSTSLMPKAQKSDHATSKVRANNQHAGSHRAHAVLTADTLALQVHLHNVKDLAFFQRRARPVRRGMDRRGVFVSRRPRLETSVCRPNRFPNGRYPSPAAHLPNPSTPSGFPRKCPFSWRKHRSMHLRPDT